MTSAIPLTLYIHIPWCIKKCPYCDFNSHALRAPIDQARYIEHLLADFTHDYDGRTLQSIFIGGGTPSIFSAESIEYLLTTLRNRSDWAHDIEITLESNPSTAEQKKFEGYYAAGVNRLSIGVQSFSTAQLVALGRIHNAQDAKNAIEVAQKSGFSSINVDLMFALPSQQTVDALADIQTAHAYSINHLSWYQLTIEPNTPFYTQPPKLPDDTEQHKIYFSGCTALSAAGFQQYEVSAWTRNVPCQHNLNYWQFGDYIGIGAGAHGKVTRANGDIYRTRKYLSPACYQAACGQLPNPYQDEYQHIPRPHQPFEFMMNALRLNSGVPRTFLSERCQCTPADIAPTIESLIARGLMQDNAQSYVTTPRGFTFLNEVLAAFLP